MSNTEKNEMNPTLIELFQSSGAKKHSLGEMKGCYEMYTKSYISKPDFIELLKANGFQPNRNGLFNIVMRKDIQKKYFEGTL